MYIDKISLFITVTKAYFDKKLDLDLNHLLALHHLIDVETRSFTYNSDLEKNLKIFKLALKRRIISLEKESGIGYRQKRKSLPIIDIQELFEKIAA